MALAIAPAVEGAFYLSAKITAIIIFLTIVFEVYEHSKLYNKTKQIISRPLNKIGISENASISMIVGLLLGIVYGSGVLIKNSIEGNMSRRDIIFTVIFLSICHAAIEDTLIFVAVGANGFIMLGTRILLALTIVAILNKLWKK